MKISEKIIFYISNEIILHRVPKYAVYILANALEGKVFHFYKGLRYYRGHYKLNESVWEQWSYYTLGQVGVSVTVKNNALTSNTGICFQVDHFDKQAAAELRAWLTQVLP